MVRRLILEAMGPSPYFLSTVGAELVAIAAAIQTVVDLRAGDRFLHTVGN